MAQILIVEDDPSIRRFLRRTLERDGHHVEEAEDGRRGLERIGTGEFEVIITDMVMPDIDGLELLKSLRAMHWTGAVLAISGGVASWSPLPIAEALGATAVLAKPFTTSELSDAVTALLEAGAVPGQVPHSSAGADPFREG